jgi:hypothetical protein
MAKEEAVLQGMFDKLIEIGYNNNETANSVLGNKFSVS